MAELVRARSRRGRTKDVFLIDRRLAEKYPNDYVLVKAKRPSKTAPAA